ncbi:MAG: prepilin-type N-terminal cleavage/methylation domain-containing protein [Acutalibacteraceae bacterium]|nr:prepilin-type N-terminal cleavage/methylation domain-containing protein [Acutalibacteraceae bacterium]
MTKAITNKSKKGFTLVELVVVVAILAILAAIAIPVVSSLINTAAKNSAASNAQTIELAVKECQAFIATKNDEVYNGLRVDGIVIPNAATAYRAINITHVAKVKAIEEAFNVVAYNGQDYIPYWIKDTDQCVFAYATAPAGVGGTVTVTDIDGNTLSNAVALSTTVGNPTGLNTIICSL